MKKAQARRGNWLWTAPLLIALIAAGIYVVPNVVNRILGDPQSLMTQPDTLIRSMALSHNGELLAAGGSILAKRGWKRGSGTVYLWNARTGQQLSTIAPVYTYNSKGQPEGFDIYGLALSPDGKQIGFTPVAANWTLYDVATQKQLWRFPSFISDAKFSNDGRFIALSGDTDISIVNAHDGKVRTKWERDSYTYSQDLAWSPNGDLVASIGAHIENNPVELHRADNGKLVRRIQSKHVLNGETRGSVAFSPDSKRLITASSIGNYESTENFKTFAPVRCYEATTGKLLWEVQTPTFGGADGMHAAFCDAIFSPDGRVVAAYQYAEGRIFLLDSITGSIIKILTLGSAEHSSFYVPPGLAFSPDGKRLFARGKSEILFWDLK